MARRGCLVLSLTLAIGACQNAESDTHSGPRPTALEESGTSILSRSPGTLAAESSIGPRATDGDPGSAALDDNQPTLTVEAIFIPVCGPSSPTDPACQPESLVGLTISLLTRSREVVATALTADDGRATFAVAPGEYVVEGSDAASAITPEAQQVTVGAGDHLSLLLAYASSLQ